MKKTRKANKKNNVTRKLNTQKINELVKSYTPTINKLLEDVTTMPDEKELQVNKVYNCKDPYFVNIKPQNKKCVKFTSKEAIKYQQQLLKMKPNYNNIQAPKQILSNCWFNAMFMSFFISDKGRIFTTMLRNIMITGIDGEGSKIPKNIHKDMYILNRCIQQSFYNIKNKYTENTNNIIHSIYVDFLKELKRNSKYNTKTNDIIKNKLRDKNHTGNPIHYLTCICRFLKFDKINITMMKYIKERNIYELTRFIERNSKNKVPDILILMYKQKTPIQNNISLKITLDNDYNINNKNGNEIKLTKYKLDSCILADNNSDHFMSFLTYNNNEYYFDGYTKSRMKKYNWKNKIQTNKDMIFQERNTSYKPQIFNFQKGLCYLIYYKT